VFRWLIDNLSTFALAFILAVFVWVVVNRETNPILDVPLVEPVPIVMLNQPAGTQVTNSPEDSIRVVVRGPKLEVDTLQPENLSAVIDLSLIDYRGVDVPVQVSVDNPLVSVVEQDIESVYVRLEEFRHFSVPITPTIVGVPALGHVSGEPTIEPSSVTVEGPASMLDQIDSAWARVSIEGERESVHQSVTVWLRDENERSVLGVDPSPSQVWITVPITKSEEYAELLVSVNLTGTVATGYRLANFSIDPQKITIYGPPEVITKLPAFLSTDLVDISDADTDITQRVGLQVPGGVTLVGDTSVVVDVDVEPVLTTSNFPWRPQILGPDPGLTVTILPETVNVSLIGPLALIDTFDPENDLNISLSLYGLESGTYQLEPNAFSNVLGVEVEGVLPPSLLVEIYPVPTPTPTATPVITTTATITGSLSTSPIATPAITVTLTPAP
jgi:YbbR domain-containing protein